MRKGVGLNDGLDNKKLIIPTRGLLQADSQSSESLWLEISRDHRLA
jgi:hypothetical protein